MMKEIERSIGRIEGKLEGISREQFQQGKMLGKIDSRLGKVEKISAGHGMVAGGLMAAIMVAGGEIIKRKLGM